MDRHLAAALTANYPRVGVSLLEPLLEFLRVARESFDGDMDKLLILTVLGLRSTPHPEFQALSPEQLRDGEGSLPGFGANVRSIAAAIPIPRETVRRKVGEMMDAGWIIREGQILYSTSRAFRDLTPLREALARQAVSNYEVVRPIAAEQG